MCLSAVDYDSFSTQHFASTAAIDIWYAALTNV